MPTTFAQTIDGNEILAKRSQCDYAGADIQTTYATKTELPSASKLVPTSTSADANKVLTVDAQGTPAWSTPAAGGVTDVEVDGVSVVSGGVASITMPTVDQTYDGTSADAQSGVAIAGEIANIAQVPAITSSDDAKVLTAAYSGGAGSYSWETPAGLFIAQYGISTYAEVKAAVGANKDVYCDVNPSSSNKRMAFLAYIGSDNFEFQYYRSNSSASGIDSVFVYKVDSRNKWTTTERAVKAGNIDYPVTDVEVDGVSVVSQGVASITMPTVDQTYNSASTNAQSGTAVAEAIATKEDAFDVGTGLEMDTSGATPTLQVEAPVDIVAGPGIVIDNPDGNTLRVSVAQAQFTELYYNATNTNDTAGKVYQLSEPITNFAYAKITVDNMEFANCPLVYEIDVQHNTTSCNWYSPLRNGNISNTINLPMCNLKINSAGNLVLEARGLTYNTYPSPQFTNGASRGFRVVRVVGIFRISGGN